MNEIRRYQIGSELWRKAFDAARQFSSQAVRARVLTTRIGTGIVREALESGGVATLPGRVERPGFAELLDIADFEAGPWRVEVRMVPEAVISGPADVIQSAGQSGLIIPTMPLMVGVLADFYLGVTVDRQLTRLSMLGFVGQSDLARAELSRNGLYLRIGPGQLTPFSLLPDFLRLPRPLNEEYLAFVEAWQERAATLVDQLRGVIEHEDGVELSAAASRRIVDLVREQLWSIQCGSLGAGADQGSWMMRTGLAPLFERLREVFGLAWPLPELDDDPIAFRNLVADQERIAAAGVKNLLEALLRDQLPVVERVALYRHLLTDRRAIRQLQADRRVIDHVTNGRHQSLPGRVGQIERRVERLDLLFDLLPEMEPAEQCPTDDNLHGSESTVGLTSLEAEPDRVLSSPIFSASWPDEFLPDSSVSQSRVLYRMEAPAPPNKPKLANLAKLASQKDEPGSPGPEAMNIFEFRDHLIADYQTYVKSFIQLREPRIRDFVDEQLREGVFCPDPLIQLNPAFARGESMERLIADKVLHPECERIFRRDKSGTVTSGSPLNLHRHQEEAIREAWAGRNYVLTTGTGSGKSLSYIIPIVNHVLSVGSGRGIRAIVVYPMNALANSQEGELDKYLAEGYPPGQPPVTYARYTGQDDREKREEILRRPPDILLTNYVMLELLLTRPFEQKIIEAAQGLRFLVLDELHTYRGRQGADVALLVRRLRDRLAAREMLCVGTSATIAGGRDLQAQREEVAAVATTIFGAEVRPESVILETLERTTGGSGIGSEEIETLRRRVVTAVVRETFPTSYAEFIADPLVAWIESNLGLEEREGRLVRRRPTRISGPDGAAESLSRLLAIPPDVCRTAIQNALLAGTLCGRHPVTGAAPLTFRLHQFISRGDTVYATLEDEASRHLTLFGQHYRPGSRDHILLPLVFCRECGQEYYIVRRRVGSRGEPDSFSPRQLSDQSVEEGVSEPGFLYFSSARPFPVEPTLMIAGQRLPLEWLVERGGVTRVDPERRDDLPQPVVIGTDGRVAGEGLTASYVTAPFRFCLACGVSSNRHQRDDFAKLTALGSEGRSTATTITNLTAIRRLRTENLPPKARKLLTFTDNRQDASLQAGHFNDFIETTLIRTALCLALAEAGEDGIAHDELTGLVFAALDLDPTLYSRQPEERYQNRKETEIALRNLLGYRLYRDLTRGWRITLPNLEQCGLLQIEYESLTEVCAEEAEWEEAHAALRAAEPEVRHRIARTLLDHMRRELAIDVRYLEPGEQDRIRTQSFQRLVAPWAIDENERMTHASIFFAGPRPARESRENHYLSSRSGFGQYLRRTLMLGISEGRLSTADIEQIIADLFAVLEQGGLLKKVVDGASDQSPGYQVNSGIMRWKYADGTTAYHDQIRTPTPPEGGGRTNPYFVDFYTSDPDDLKYLEAREHTAQVPADLREEREQHFREGSLPILYCSPTMELGVDISDLNVVNLRNVPPTPANYAQRSGRAGRSGQPALVFTYCTIGSPHDQYFFKRPELMVAGQVTPPRLDLANEDLVRSHVHAIWLAETAQSLQRSLVDLLDVSGEPASLGLLPGLRERIDSELVRRRAAVRAHEVLATIRPQLEQAGWYSDGWLEEILGQAADRFDRTCDRWRDLYRAALNEQEIQSRVIRDASRSAEDKRVAKQTRALAEAQINLLTNVGNATQSDFYSYRYFASEGFLPGYSFPRLPISAFVPARRGGQERNEYVSRPRFLAISEFGPRSIIYHEGAKYVINKVILPVGEEEVGQAQIKLCGACGYLHEVRPSSSHDLCERCQHPLGAPLTSLFRMQNVSTRRRERITSDEEERLRYGYEIITGVRFSGSPAETPSAEVVAGGERLARLTFGQAATLWRINKGWQRRKQREKLGFVLDLERGYWKNDTDESGEENAESADEPNSGRSRRVIPYVDDRRNCLLYEPETPLTLTEMASLQAALKAAIQVCYQLEDSELAVEPLPSPEDRRQLLFYESAEGGAGVLHRLVREPGALARVAAVALDLCHFDQEGQDLGQAPNARERCEAACYDCLLSYGNQREHEIVDRHSIREILRRLSVVEVLVSPVAAPRGDHLAALLARSESSLEREWLTLLAAGGYRLPTIAQALIESAGTRPDFLYENESVAVYIDGPDHKHPEAQQHDRRQEEALADQGYSVIRFAVGADWEAIIGRYPHVFGVISKPPAVSPVAELSAPVSRVEDFDLDLFDERFHELLRHLAQTIPELRIEPGGDVLVDGRVIGAYFAEIERHGIRVRLIESGRATNQQVCEAIAGDCDPLVVRLDEADQVVKQIRLTFGLK